MNTEELQQPLNLHKIGVSVASPLLLTLQQSICDHCMQTGGTHFVFETDLFFV